MYDDTRLKEGLTSLSIPFDDEKISKLHRYYELMVSKNQVMNLTAITDYEEVVVKHWLDSLCFVKAYRGEKDARLIDIGTGAGFPGIPIKIFCPELEIVLLDSLQKRVLFLQDVVSGLGLTAISCIHGRAEELSRKEDYRETFDYAVSRAVARLASLSELCIPFVRPGGRFLSYKADGADAEISEGRYAVTTLGGRVGEVLNYDIPTSDLPRKMVVIEKTSQTPPKYPRGGGKPMKAPLLK